MRVGDRVRNPYLGLGMVSKLYGKGYDDWAVEVRYDVDPPIEYNMRENPTFTLTTDLTQITGE